MKKLNLLSRAEMRNVMGGVISPEVWFEMCIEGAFIYPPMSDNTPEEQTVIKNFIRTECENMYNHMT